MKITRLLLLGLCLWSCASEQPDTAVPPTKKYAEITDFSPADTLFLVENETGGETTFGYTNQLGEVIIPFGQFEYAFSDTILTFGLVVKDSELIGINQQGERLYEVFQFDNGPDYLADGLFRILKNDRIGYADAAGRIVIEPQFACADPFDSGRAKVAINCTTSADGEHTVAESGEWFYINKRGQKLE